MFKIISFFLIPFLFSCATPQDLSKSVAHNQIELTLERASPPPNIHPYSVTIQKPNLWPLIKSTFVLNHQITNRAVRKQINSLNKNPNYFVYIEQRIKNYLPYIFSQIKDRGLPGELALLPIVESALDPYAFSSGGASGLWQFMPPTGKRFNLEQNWWQDQRRDLIAATDAALDYLEILYARFEDWPLAIAAYNAGEGTVEKARRKKSRRTGFWNLKLPKETKQYLPRLLALAAIIDNPAKYKVVLPRIDPSESFIVLNTHSQLDLEVASEHLNISLDILYEWNPALSKWATPPEGPHRLLVPAITPNKFQESISNIPEKERINWSTITIKAGDTLSQLAMDHKTNTASLIKTNSLKTDLIRAGDRILVPRTSGSKRIEKGTSHGYYEVKKGDSLWSIAHTHDLSITTIVKLNKISPKTPLAIGKRLKLPNQNRTVNRTINYRIKHGDSLSLIAHRFNLRITQIEKWNEINRSDYVHPGQYLKLYINVIATD